MNLFRTFLCSFFVLLPALASGALFDESFTGGTADWKDNFSLDLTSASGGPQGDFVTAEFSFSTVSPPMNPSQPPSSILFRAHDEFGSSDGQYMFDWLAAGVQKVKALVRHDAPLPLTFFTRIAERDNNPGVNILTAAPIPAGVWTPIEFDISITNPLLTVGAAPSQIAAAYNSVFAGTLANPGPGHVQIGVVVAPSSLLQDSALYTFDLDSVSVVVPEPASVFLAIVAMVGLMARRERRES